MTAVFFEQDTVCSLSFFGLAAQSSSISGIDLLVLDGVYLSLHHAFEYLFCLKLSFLELLFNHRWVAWNFEKIYCFFIVLVFACHHLYFLRKLIYNDGLMKGDWFESFNRLYSFQCFNYSHILILFYYFYR